MLLDPHDLSKAWQWNMKKCPRCPQRCSTRYRNSVIYCLSFCFWPLWDLHANESHVSGVAERFGDIWPDGESYCSYWRDRRREAESPELNWGCMCSRVSSDNSIIILKTVLSALTGKKKCILTIFSVTVTVRNVKPEQTVLMYWNKSIVFLYWKNTV